MLLGEHNDLSRNLSHGKRTSTNLHDFRRRRGRDDHAAVPFLQSIGATRLSPDGSSSATTDGSHLAGPDGFLRISYCSDAPS